HHIDGALDAFAHAGYKTEKTFPHWLSKAKRGRNCVDLIFRAGNGLCEVDDSWFERAQDEDVLGVTVKLSAPEDMLWMKAYIMERERYDGADVAHILESCAEKLNWPHLLRRFGPDWRLLLSHLVLFGYIYPSERGRVPVAIMDALLSREQYLWDVEERGFRDARLEKRAHMNEGDIAHWTKAIAKETRRKKRAGEIPHPK